MKKEAKKPIKLGINRETIKKLANENLELVHGGDSLKTMCSPLPTLQPAC
jgi:hypothetical protein